MKKLVSGLVLCFTLIFALITLTACGNETNALNARITELERDNAELQTTISSLRTELEVTQTNLTNTQTELYNLQTAIEEEAEQATQQDDQSGPLAITYGGRPNPDMSWPLSYGELRLGLRIDFNDFDDDVEITWHSGNEDFYTVEPGEDGTTATVTPLAVGDAQLTVTVGDQETKSWVRITRDT